MVKFANISNFFLYLLGFHTSFSVLEFDFRVANTQVFADSGLHCCLLHSCRLGRVWCFEVPCSFDLKGCLSSLIPLLTSHPSLSPPLRKAETKAPSSGSAELPPEYLTSPLSQQSQVNYWKLVCCTDAKCKHLTVLDVGLVSAS